MPLESATYINGLDITYPVVGDNVSQGDDHIRLLKSTIKATFPNITGAVTPTHTELNFVDGVTSAIQTQLNTLDTRLDTAESNITALQAALNAPTNTKMLFYSNTAPSGWTLVALGNTYGLVIGEGTKTGGTTWGSHDPVTMDKVPSHTHTVSGTAASDGAHTHNLPTGTGGGAFGSTRAYNVTSSLETDSQGAHTHTVTGTAAANGGASNWTPRQVGVRIANKD